MINGYLLALAALFALGGKLSDVLGHRRMVLVGTIGFAAASALCGATPTGRRREAWLIAARLLQGAFGALLFPAALAIVFNAFAARERGKALALFFGISGALTSIGPIAGSFLLPWTWRAIFLDQRACRAGRALADVAGEPCRTRAGRRRSTGAARLSSLLGWRSPCSGCSRPATGAGARSRRGPASRPVSLLLAGLRALRAAAARAR